MVEGWSVAEARARREAAAGGVVGSGAGDRPFALPVVDLARVVGTGLRGAVVLLGAVLAGCLFLGRRNSGD